MTTLIAFENETTFFDSLSGLCMPELTGAYSYGDSSGLPFLRIKLRSSGHRIPFSSLEADLMSASKEPDALIW
jgi:hypothetical protein